MFQPALLFPFGGNGAVNNIHGFDEEGGRAGGGVEDLDERFVGRNGAGVVGFVGQSREFQAGVFLDHLAPGNAGC